MWNLCAMFSVALDPYGEFDWKLLSNFLKTGLPALFFSAFMNAWHVRNSAAKCEVVGPNGLRNGSAQGSDGEGETKEWTWYWPCNWKCKYSLLQGARTIFIYRKQALFRETYSQGTWRFVSQFCLRSSEASERCVILHRYAKMCQVTAADRKPLVVDSCFV